jgi:hypothetical protein
MARPLTFVLDQVMQRPKRRPHWKVYLYDLRSTADTMGFIVRGLPLDPLTGPLDITDHVAVVDVVERAGDFASSGIPSAKITLSILDETPGSEGSRWDPQVSAGDSTAPARFLRRGNVVRLVEGDLDVDPGEWPVTFTGRLVGQPGVDRGRAIEAQGRSVVTMAAVSREAEFVNLNRDSDDFARGTSYLLMAETVAQEDMGLDIDEIEFGAWGSQTTGLKMQFADQSPLVTIAQLMFVDGFMPRFTGEGKLSQTFADIAKTPARFYQNEVTIRHIAKPYVDADPINSVHVIGIEGVKTKTTQEFKPLIEVSLTTGYFTSDESIDYYWSEDRTQLAENIQLQVIKSVNGGLSILGGGETWAPIAAPGGSGLIVGATLQISTGFAPYIIVFLTVTYAVLAFVPDEVTTALVVGLTIPIGRVYQAVALAAIMLLMTKIGRGQYTFAGDPVEFIYQEIMGIAEIDGLLTEELRELTIDNHLVQTQAQADASALLVLFRQQARGNQRNVLALHDLRLEPHDVFEISDGRRFLIEQISRRLVRDVRQIEARYATHEVTAGVTP